MSKFSDMFKAKDMTVGTPWKRIVEFSIPMIIGNIAQQLYNTVDTVIVGKFVGDNALAAVGSSSPVLSFLIVLFVGISSGAGIMVSQYFGAREKEHLANTIGTCITLTAIASVVIMIVGPITTRTLLELLRTPESIIGWCSDYLRIYYTGILGFAYYNILAGILRGLGDSFSALMFLIVSTILNIVLDIWFVASLGLGVKGVALATVIAQSISAILCLVKLFRMKDLFNLTLNSLRLKSFYTGKLIKLGIPTGITQGIFSLAMIVVQSLTNSFGEMVIACNVIVMRVDGFAMMPNFSFGMAMTTYSGQNIGANKLDRVKEGTKSGIKIAVGTSIVITCIILIFGKYLMAIFTDTHELVELSMHMMRILAFGYIAMAVTESLSGVIMGAGDTMTPMWISLVTTVILRVPIAYGIAYFTKSAQYPAGRPESTFISLLISWTIGAVITVIVYKRGKWKNKRIMHEEEYKACIDDSTV